MKSLGINIGSCGVDTIRLRPMLIFEECHGKVSEASRKKMSANVDVVAVLMQAFEKAFA